jgi:hypothetical protein
MLVSIQKQILKIPISKNIFISIFLIVSVVFVVYSALESDNLIYKEISSSNLQFKQNSSIIAKNSYFNSTISSLLMKFENKNKPLRIFCMILTIPKNLMIKVN